MCRGTKVIPLGNIYNSTASLTPVSTITHTYRHIYPRVCYLLYQCSKIPYHQVKTAYQSVTLPAKKTSLPSLH